MRERPEADWDPGSEAVLRDQRAAFDEMRERCPVAYSERLGWSLFRHADVLRALHDHVTFSNAVSRHVSVPNGMDPPEHTLFRAVIEPYFAPGPLRAFAPRCRAIAAELVAAAVARGEAEAIADLAAPFAVRVQCVFLGWPPALAERLHGWNEANRAAVGARDSAALAALAAELEDIVGEMLDERRRAGALADGDVTASLLHETVRGARLEDRAIASILRNWTVGELGTIAAALGVVVHHLAHHADLQERLRAEPQRLPAAIDEMLRIDGPLVANRRVTTRPVVLGGREIGPGEPVSLVWIAANRDGRAFADVMELRESRDPAQNLLYGAGIHVCPGAPLARLELRLFTEEILLQTASLEPASAAPAPRARYPASGFAAVPVRLCARRTAHP